MATADAQSDIPEQAAGTGRFAGVDIRQWIKIAVYSLLLVNFVHYLGNDINVARHTVHYGWKIHD
ncbi:MAG: hypothetical protein AAGL66_19705, partial [Pseudomonadota bacterium]